MKNQNFNSQFAESILTKILTEYYISMNKEALKSLRFLSTYIDKNSDKLILFFVLLVDH